MSVDYCKANSFVQKYYYAFTRAKFKKISQYCHEKRWVTYS